MTPDSTSDEYLAALGESVPVTRAGREVFDKYVEHYQYRVIRELNRQRRLDAVDPESRVGAEEVAATIRHLEETGALTARLPVPRPGGGSLAGLLAVFAAIAAGIAALGATIISVAINGFKESDVTWIVAAAALVAVVVAVFGLVASFSLRRAKKLESRQVSAGEFVRQMAQVERAAMRLAQAAGVLGDEKYMTLGRVLDALVRANFWTPEDLREYRTLLRVRNAIVHEDQLTLEPDVLTQALADAIRLEEFLRDQLARLADGRVEPLSSGD